MIVKMTALSRTDTGRYVARKVIPSDCRDEYARRYGPRREAKLSIPSTTDEATAKVKFTAWLTEVEDRIATIRNGGNGLHRPQISLAKHIAISVLSPWKLFEQWAREVKPAPSTIARWRHIFRDLEAEFGDRIIKEDDAHEWARKQITTKRAPITVRDIHVSAAKTVYAWAKKQRLVASNPFAEVEITVPRKAQNRESKAFSWSEVMLILSAASLIRPKSTFDYAKRWVPWLLAYSGARGAEAAQLRGQDVFERDGHWFMRITPEAGSVKTGRARTVPIHAHVIEQGFLKYVEQRGGGPLFYDPVSKTDHDPMKPKQPRYVKARLRLAEWIRSLGINDPEVSPTHGFRHAFKQVADRAGISERMSDAITGHSPLNISRTYGTATPDDLAEAMKRFPRYEW